MESKVEKANAWGSLITIWGKVLIGLFIFLFTVGTAWYQIETNSVNNIRQDDELSNMVDNQHAQFERLMEAMTKEFDVMARRSDKRYSRAMQEAENLHKKDEKHDQQILDIYKELWYLKGKLDK